ncbi:MAG: MlaE family lipid ABC transporter permease subunit [Deltaproteobacteria bacterium]|nr:MlaE family lipid ABC transporter permease subunit [Deltaproteobacteria bacterium]
MLKLPARLTRHEVAALGAAIDAALGRRESVSIDLGDVCELDSAGVALLAGLQRRMSAGERLQITHPRPEVVKTLALFPFVDRTPAAPVEQSVTERVGEWALVAREAALDYLVLCADVAWFCVAGLFRGRGIRWSQVAFEMASMGSKALGVVGLIAFLVGGTIALQSALQLRQFGANIFVADLISVSLTRELGPLMAAVVVAGRSGSAVAAELATMTITEEVDAIRTLGLHPVRFLVLPKFIAISITQPLVTVLADALGIGGGFLVAITYLGVGPGAFLARMQQALLVKDLLTGLFKSVLFAQLIVTIGATCGMRTRGGADAVGRSTTTSVVASIFAVIVADAICSMIFYFGG